MSDGAGLYIHVPYCSAICPYCDFAVTLGGPRERRDFVGDLVIEIERAACRLEAYGTDPRFDTVYLGGGTPSALAPNELETILEALHRHLPVDANAVLHMEANPEDVTTASVSAWRAAGVSFLSLGVQSFDDEELRFLGRRHDATEARRAVAVAQSAGFETVSADVIFGLPDQTEATLGPTLDTVVELGVSHASAYQLTVKAGTPFERRRDRGGIVELDDLDQSDLHEVVHSRLASRGLSAYEVSNFAANRAHRSKHNSKYWSHAPYLGLGPSAHSFDGRARFWNERDPAVWATAVRDRGEAVAGREILTADDILLEMVMLRLRCTDGLDLAGVESRFGVDLRALNAARLGEWSRAGLVTLDDGCLRPTRKGLAVADGMAAALDMGTGS